MYKKQSFINEPWNAPAIATNAFADRKHLPCLHDTPPFTGSRREPTTISMQIQVLFGACTS
jgi:hypothetical protein